MGTIRDWFAGKKTYLLAIIGVIVVVVKFLAGDLDVLQFIQSPELYELLVVLGLATLRAGVAKAVNGKSTT